MVEKLGEITEREFRGYWDQTIADASDTGPTLHAMAAEIRSVGDLWRFWQAQLSWRGSERPSRLPDR